MSLKINGTDRLSLQKLIDYRDNSGITERQYQIIKRKYFDRDNPNMIAICDELNIGTATYSRDLNKAIATIYCYNQRKL